MGQTGLEIISRVKIPIEFVNSIYDSFRENGEAGFECVVLLAGRSSGFEFHVSHLIFPKQYHRKIAKGVSYYVEQEELERIDDWLLENKCELIAQIHSHPESAFHSDADDTLAIITKIGGLSIVVPFFGMTDYPFRETAVFRLVKNFGWQELNRKEIEELIQIIE